MDGLKAPISKFAKDSAEDLLGYIAIDQGGHDGRAAGAELYARFSEKLFKILRQSWVRSVVHDQNDLVDLVHDTFVVAYNAAGTYSGRSNAACLAWLIGIARNLAKQALSQERHQREELALEDPPEPEVELVFAEEIKESSMIGIVKKAVENLDERAQDVMAVTADHHQPGATNQRLPNKVSSDLATRWGTTAANIRRIRKRATDTLRAELEPHLKTRGGR